MPVQFKMLIALLAVTTISVFLTASYSGWIELKMPSSCRCEKCFSEEDVFLNQHLNRSIEPFLSATTKLTEDEYNWWRHLQRNRHNFNYFKATLDKLFKIISPTPVLEKSKTEGCRTCAVVGNSVNLKGSRYGPLIDFQDIVIRINQGPTKGFEEDVGSRTTHRVMYPESGSVLDNSTHLVMFIFKIRDLEWLLGSFLTGTSGKPVNPRANKDLVMVLNPAFMKYVHQKWLGKKGKYPSTGFMTLISALHICDEVSVFGYGADDDGNWSHYFETLKSKNFKTGPHPGKHEYALIHELAQNKTIRLYKGW
ncbi:PREDICTED: CMP-N-acetylneuraminate-beta-galactosamide-alpha-2,3-sialyltransferase 1-like isoform X2 [Poecilia mexicana]|uniref:CMP-N-acetylneuraminate-beta-galactosamide- alpha-2,3-sialyltransferase 1-like isoform X2 n=1 Tax=Poecilia mexicana TaxID=48701 RepID=UPI00072EB267|nr:PREDICTED: CMP-N-acetylneuraminate-beta-galactosamide-alpha-2,3-sialyltransferase 1-like isoform X2 [Poecilia mexicana]